MECPNSGVVVRQDHSYSVTTLIVPEIFQIPTYNQLLDIFFLNEFIGFFQAGSFLFLQINGLLLFLPFQITYTHKKTETLVATLSSPKHSSYFYVLIKIVNV
jgi:hypothetical protein